MSALNGFSQVYILMAWIPLIISFVNRTLSSVLIAVLNLSSDDFLPSHPEEFQSQGGEITKQKWYSILYIYNYIEQYVLVK